MKVVLPKVAMPDATLDRLNEALSLTARDFIHYILDVAVPVREAADREIGELLRSMASEEEAMADAIASLIEEQGGVPEPSPYPIDHGHYNFLRLLYLLPALCEALKRNVLRFEAVVESTRDAPLVSTRLREILLRKSRFVERLEDARKKLLPGDAQDRPGMSGT